MGMFSDNDDLEELVILGLLDEEEKKGYLKNKREEGLQFWGCLFIFLSPIFILLLFDILINFFMKK
ncbi:MAG: hypothetical protein ACRC37_06185 [Lentisphaeria bacterium]